MIESSLSYLLQLFSSENCKKLVKNEIKSSIFFTKDEVIKLIQFLKLFTQVKIKDPLVLNMLKMDSVSKHITLERISNLVKHNTAFYRNYSTPDFDFVQKWDDF